MSREMVETVRWAFAAPDASRFYSLLDEDVEWDGRAMELPGHDPEGRGRKSLEQYSRNFWGAWTGYSAEPTDFIDAGDEIVVEVHERGIGKGSGAPFARTHFQVWTFRDGKVTGWRLYRDRAQALEAVGLRD